MPAASAPDAVPDADAPVLRVEGISKRFGSLQAVRDVSLRVAPGETYGLLGPNGAGKSTSISIISGLIDADTGTVEVLGQPVSTRTTAVRASIGLVPQESAVYPDLTARENLRFFARLYDLDRAALDHRVDEVLDVVGLAGRADDRVSTYSGGMTRRLNIGIGLLHRPRLLVLDEPTVGVDPQSRNAILEAVERLSGEGTAVLYTTHYMEEAERLCDRIGIIDEGELKAEGTRRELTTRVGESERLRITASGPLDTAIPGLEALAGVVAASPVDGGVDLLVVDAGSVVAAAIEVVTAAGASVTSVAIEQPDLEAVFLHLTGKALRD